MPKAKTYAWKDPAGLTNITLAVLMFDLAWNVSGIPIRLFWSSALDFDKVPTTNWGMVQAVGWFYSLLGLLTLLGGVVMVLWILRVSRNAHTLKGRSLQNSPIFAALWWYVIPFMSLFKPVESMSEIWDASGLDAKRRDHYRIVLMVWWGAHVAANIFSYVVMLSHNMMAITLIQSALATLACIAFAYIVWRISRMQTESWTVAEFAGPTQPLSIIEQLSS